METLRSEGKNQPFCFGINKVINPLIDCWMTCLNARI